MKVDVSKERPSYAKFSGFLYTPSLLNGQNPPSWPETLRSSHPEVFCKKGVLRNFAKFIGKHLRIPFFTEHLLCLLLNIL